MSFLEPLMLWALPLAAIPIIIHLINQRRFQTINWAAMMFLLAANKMSRGYSRVRQWLILACRTLAIAGLLLAISRPLASGLVGLVAGGLPDATIVLLDRSPSMAEEGTASGLSKLEMAKTRLVDTFKTIGSKRYIVIDSVSLTPQELDRPEALLQLATASTVGASTDIPRLLQAGYDYVRGANVGRTEVWLVSDVRANDWSEGSSRWQTLNSAFREFPQSVRFHLLSYADRSASNVSIRSTGVRRVEGNESAEVLVSAILTRDGESTGPQTVPVEFEIDGSRSVMNVEMVGPRYELKDHRLVIERGRDQGWGRISIPADANPADNSAYFVFEKPKPRRTLVVCDDSPVQYVVNLATSLSADSGLPAETQVVAPDEALTADWEGTALVVWQSRLPTGQVADLMTGLVQRGGQVVFLPPAQPGTESFAGIRWSQWDQPETPVRVETWRSDQDALRNTEGGASLPVGDLSFKRYCKPEGEGTSLATLAGGAAVVLRAGPIDSTASEANSTGNSISAASSVQSPGSGVQLPGSGGTDPRGSAAGGGVYFVGTLPVDACSNLAGNGVVLYAFLQRVLTAGAISQSTAVSRTAGEFADGRSPQGWERLLGPDGISTEFGWLTGVYRHGTRVYAVNRSAAEDHAVAVAKERVDSLFSGLDFLRVDDSADSLSTLIQEIWKAFLVLMLVVLWGEAMLCLPKRVVEAPVSPQDGFAMAKGGG